MDESAVDDKAMVQYLLGQLSEDERVRIEESFFEDDGVFERLRSVEDDLIDDYVNGRLAIEPQKAFQRRMRSDPRWKQRVVFAEALAKRVSASPARARGPARTESFLEILARAFRAQKPRYQLGEAAAAFVAVIGLLWLSSQMLNERAHVRALQAERQTLQTTVDDLNGQIATLQQRGESLNAELEQERVKRQELESRGGNIRSPLGLVASFILKAGLVRGPGDSFELTLPPGARTARLQLELDPAEDYASYRANLRTAAGDLRQSSDRLRAENARGARFVALDVPVERLAAGNYEMELSGRKDGGNLEEVAYYYFTVR